MTDRDAAQQALDACRAWFASADGLHVHEQGEWVMLLVPAINVLHPHHTEFQVTTDGDDIILAEDGDFLYELELAGCDVYKLPRQKAWVEKCLREASATLEEARVTLRLDSETKRENAGAMISGLCTAMAMAAGVLYGKRNWYVPEVADESEGQR